jgi:uncharacterized protein (DUF952 family)
VDVRIYKILSRDLWRAAERAGQFDGAAVDLADGYIHFSTAAQVRETAAKHFAGQTDLVILSVEADDLGAHLRWEPSRGGDLFPHLYTSLSVSQVQSVHELPLLHSGMHDFGDLPA